MTPTTNPRTRALRAAAVSRAQYAVDFWTREANDTSFMILFHASDDATVAYLRECRTNLRAAQATLSALV